MRQLHSFGVIRLRGSKPAAVLCFLLVLAVGVFTAKWAWKTHPIQAESVSAGAEPSIEIPIVMYHHFLEEPGRLGDYVVSPQQFADDLAYLQQLGYTTVTTEDLIQYVDNNVPLPDKPVMITIDDGYESVYAYAYPILKQFESKAVVAVIGRFSQEYSHSSDHSVLYSHLTWDQIGEMSQSGLIEFANHSYDLHDSASGARRLSGESTGEYRLRLSRDVLQTQELLKDASGTLAHCFAYPFGFYSKDSDSILASLNFRVTLSCEERISRICRGDPQCLYRLGRFNRPASASRDTFFKKALGL